MAISEDGRSVVSNFCQNVTTNEKGFAKSASISPLPSFGADEVALTAEYQRSNEISHPALFVFSSKSRVISIHGSDSKVFKVRGTRPDSGKMVDFSYFEEGQDLAFFLLFQSGDLYSFTQRITAPLDVNFINVSLILNGVRSIGRTSISMGAMAMLAVRGSQVGDITISFASKEVKWRPRYPLIGNIVYSKNDISHFAMGSEAFAIETTMGKRSVRQTVSVSDSKIVGLGHFARWILRENGLAHQCDSNLQFPCDFPINGITHDGWFIDGDLQTTDPHKALICAHCKAAFTQAKNYQNLCPITAHDGQIEVVMEEVYYSLYRGVVERRRWSCCQKDPFEAGCSTDFHKAPDADQ